MTIKKSFHILGLHPDATPDEIKQAYRARVKENHPDLAGSSPLSQKQADERMKDINAAYRSILEYKAKEQKTRREDQRTYQAHPNQHTGPSKKSSPRQRPPGPEHQGASARHRHQTFKNTSGQTIRNDQNLFVQLMSLIVSGLSRIDIRKIVPGSKRPHAAKKSAGKKTRVPPDRKRNFDEILNDMMKKDAFPENSRRKRQRKTGYYHHAASNRRTNQRRENGPVESVKPVTRVKGVYRDR